MGGGGGGVDGGGGDGAGEKLDNLVLCRGGSDLLRERCRGR